MNRPAHLVASKAYAGFTAAEFVHMVDGGGFGDLRAELVEGEIVKMMPSYLAHGEANMLLGARLLPLYAGTARVAVDLMIEVAPNTIRAADLAVVRIDAPRDRPLLPNEVIMIVEIANTSLAEDLGRKLQHYAAAGIRHYWVVDLEAQVVHVMSDPSDGKFDGHVTARFGETLAVPETGHRVAVG